MYTSVAPTFDHIEYVYLRWFGTSSTSQIILEIYIFNVTLQSFKLLGVWSVDEDTGTIVSATLNATCQWDVSGIKITYRTKLEGGSSPNRIYRSEKFWTLRVQGKRQNVWKKRVFYSTHTTQFRKPSDRGICRSKVIIRCDNFKHMFLVDGVWTFWTWQVTIDSGRWILFCASICRYVPEEKKVRRLKGTNNHSEEADIRQL